MAQEDLVQLAWGIGKVVDVLDNSVARKGGSL